MISENYGNHSGVVGTGLVSPKNKNGDLTPYSNQVELKKGVSFFESSQSLKTSKAKLVVKKKRQIKMAGSKNVLINHSMEISKQPYSSVNAS